MAERTANRGSFQPGHKRGGRPAKTDDERAAYLYLCERTVGAAKRLVELEASTDEKIALGATLGHLKIVVGDVTRAAAKDGSQLPAAWTYEEYMAALAATRAARHGP